MADEDLGSVMTEGAWKVSLDLDISLLGIVMHLAKFRLSTRLK